MRKGRLKQPRQFASLALVAAFAAPAAIAAQPGGAVAVAIHGQATLGTHGNQLTVTTRNGAGTRHSAIDWQSFSVPQGSITRFDQPDAASTSINRVLGNDPSRILGTLSSNGRLVLVNPAGITVGQGAAVDTAGFTASTLRMSDADALAGRMRFDGGPAGSVLEVDGRITARVGDVVLIASNIAVGGTAFIHAPDGAVALAAGQKVELTGRGLEGIRMELVAPAGTVINFGALQGDAVGMFAANLRHSGLIRAEGAELDGNKLRLVATRSSTVDGVIRTGRDLPLAAVIRADDDKDQKEKDEKEKDKDKEKDKHGNDNNANSGNAGSNGDPGNSGNSGNGNGNSGNGNNAGGNGNGNAGNGNGAGGNPGGSAAGPAPAPAPSPGSATPPVVVAAPPAAPAPAPQSSPPAPSPASSDMARQIDVPVQSIVHAMHAQEQQVISYLTEPVEAPAASTAARRKRDRESPLADSAQCVP